MYICLTVLIGLMGICIGALIGLGISFKINHTYILEMNNITKDYLEKRIFRYNYDRFGKSSR